MHAAGWPPLLLQPAYNSDPRSDERQRSPYPVISAEMMLATIVLSPGDLQGRGP